MFDQLASLAIGRGRLVLVIAVALAIAAGIIGAGVADRLDPYADDDPATESIQADEALADAGFRDATVLVLVDDADVRSPAGAARVKTITKAVESDPAVKDVNGFADTGSKAFVSSDHDSTYLAVSLKTTDDLEEQDASERIEGALAHKDGVEVGGFATAQRGFNHQVEVDLRRAELIAFPILLLLSFIFFRSFIAALLPLVVGLLTILATFVALGVAAEVTPISVFALNVVTGLGLGLSIDYSLFIVSRYREESAKSGPGLEAMKRTLGSAGRTVLFSAITVAASLSALLVFPQRFLYSMGLGGAMVTVLAAVIALVVLPAILAVLGDRINSLTPKFLTKRAERDTKPVQDGFWYRLSRFVQRRPGPIAAACAGLLIVLGIPFYGIKFTTVDAQSLPESNSARVVDDSLRANFPPYHDTPIQLYLEGERPAAESLANQIGELKGVAEVQPPVSLQGHAWLVNAISKHSALSDQSHDLVEQVREIEGPALSTGYTAGFIDLHESLIDHLPIALAIVALATIVVLFLMTGSVILPIKQLLMNALSLSAVFGILVLVFQDGRLEGLLGYDSQGALESTQPLLLFAISFGLSTDYGVFLLGRIKEARDGGASDSEAVATGLERTGRIVTAAAFLFCIAIGAFITSQIIFIKELGLGIALAVLIDATIVRALLVPSLMQLLGRRNWWAPAPLRRLHARIGVSES